MAKRLTRFAALAVCLLVAVGAAGAQTAGEPHAPKLDGGAQPPPPAVQPGEAKRLPATIAICQNATTRQCWMARNEAECGAPPAALFRLVINDPARPDMADALAACRDAVRP